MIVKRERYYGLFDLSIRKIRTYFTGYLGARSSRPIRFAKGEERRRLNYNSNTATPSLSRLRGKKDERSKIRSQKRIKKRELSLISENLKKVPRIINSFRAGFGV